MASVALLMTFLWGGCGGRGPQITGEEFAGRLPSVLTKTDTIETSEETIQEIQEVLSSAPRVGITEESTKESAGDIVEEVEKEPDPEEVLYEALFDWKNRITIELEIEDTELNKLQKDYEKYHGMGSKSPIYRVCKSFKLTVGEEIYELEEVGVRPKGNYFRKSIYNPETGVPGLMHYRFSFDETFEDEAYYGADAKTWEDKKERKERKNRTLASLKGLEVRFNANYDDTHIREIYNAKFFEEQGLLAQKCNLCQLIVNGNNYGVFIVYEPIDELFIEHHLPEEDWGGDLYKCGAIRYVSQATYLLKTASYGIKNEDEKKFYNYDLKTNKKSSAHEALLTLLEIVNQKDLTAEQLESVVDMDYFAKFMAAGYFTGNPDDYRNNYNNHYLYFLKSSGKAVFIPYDCDRCFGVTFEWNADGTGLSQNSPFSEFALGKKNEQQNPITRSCVLKDSLFFEKYVQALKKVGKSPSLSNEPFVEVYEMMKKQYEDVVKPYRWLTHQVKDYSFSLTDEYDESGFYNMSFEEFIDNKMRTFQKEMEGL